MVTMIDEIYDRDYQAAAPQLNARSSLPSRGSAEAIGNSFKVLHRIEYSAPWLRQAPRRTPAVADGTMRSAG